MHSLPFPGPDGNSGGNSNPGEPSKDPLNLYGTAGQRSDKALSPVPQPDKQ
ncbi:hypothetical protein ACFPPE_07225 [Agromyces tardus]|uniref:hypothetical protein n=1 Tax=Agromyces tardus TaxID=2583849 RepID=UPI003610D94E